MTCPDIGEDYDLAYVEAELTGRLPPERRNRLLIVESGDGSLSKVAAEHMADGPGWLVQYGTVKGLEDADVHPEWVSKADVVLTLDRESRRNLRNMFKKQLRYQVRRNLDRGARKRIEREQLISLVDKEMRKGL